MTSCVFVYIYLFVFCSQGTQPTGGLGKLTNRAAQAQNVGAKEAEKEPLKYLAPGDKMYTKMASEAAEYQVSVDLFLLTNNQYVDVASLGTLPRITGGSLCCVGDPLPCNRGNQVCDHVTQAVLS